MTEVIEGAVVDDAPDADDAPVAATPASTAIARRERRSEVIRPLAADAVVESFHAYQELLPQLLVASDYQQAEAGKRFVKKSGWRKIATAFDLDVVRISEGVDRDDNGAPVRAWAVYRAIAPSGRTMDGDGYCSADEPRFNRASGRQKLENDLRATATTRAKNRAISDLVGMGEVSAEEVDAAAAVPSADPPPLPAWAQPASDNLRATADRAIAFMLDVEPNDPAVGLVRAALQADYGSDAVPQIAARAVVHLAKAVRERAATSSGADEPPAREDAPTTGASSPATPDPDPDVNEADVARQQALLDEGGAA